MKNQYGPDRATFSHWLDRHGSRAVIGACDVLRAFRQRHGHPARIHRQRDKTTYCWHSGFDLFSLSIYKKTASSRP